MQKNIGLLVAGIWFILYGLMSILHLSFEGLPIIMGLLALIAGICLVIAR